MYDIITFGSATVDVFAKTNAETISFRNNSHKEEFIAYLSGSKILIEELDFQIGGGGTNTAVGFSRLGLNTAFCGVIGKCKHKYQIIELLEKEKINFIGIEKDGQTGYSIILDSYMDDRTILTYKGVNDLLDYNEIDKKKLKAKYFYFSSLMGKSFDTFIKLTEYAKKNKIKIVFNPSSYIAKKGIDYLKKPIKNTNILIFNLEEARLLTKSKDCDVKKLLKKVSSYGPEIVVITDGKNGAYVYDKKQNKIFFGPAKKVKIKETTGAGDSFASGFVSGIILKNDIKFGLNLGMANALSVIKKIGAKNNLLTMKKAITEIKKNEKIILL
jgi:ribokinase